MPVLSSPVYLSRPSTAQLWLAVGLILSAVFARWVPDMAGFSPLVAVSVVAGLTLSSRWLAAAVPIATMAITDLVYGIDATWWVVYLSLAAVALLVSPYGQRARSEGSRFFGANLLGSLAGGVIFFLTTNFAVWALTDYYPSTVQGLVTSYIAGIPFLLRGLAGDIFFALGYSVAIWFVLGAARLRMVERNGGQKGSMA